MDNDGRIAVMDIPDDEIRALVDDLAAEGDLQLTPPEVRPVQPIDVAEKDSQDGAEGSQSADVRSQSDEIINDYATNDDKYNDEAPHVDYDVFEAGCLWTQGASTQMQHRAWRRGWRVSSSPSYDAEQDFQEDYDDRDGVDAERPHAIYTAGEAAGPSTTRPTIPDRAVRARVPNTDDNVIDLASSQEDESQERNSDVRNGGSASTSWWDKGKTAPLLHDYDEERRAWYMEMAGLYDQTLSVHGAEAPQQDSTVNTPHRVLIMGARTLHSATTPVAGASTDEERHTTAQGSPSLAVNTPRTPFALAQPRASTSALMSSAPRMASGMHTPKRKTWKTTWGSVTSEDRTPAGMHKSARGNDRSASAGSAQRMRTSFSTGTPTSAGRGRGTASRGTPRGRGIAAPRGRGARVSTPSRLR